MNDAKPTLQPDILQENAAAQPTKPQAGQENEAIAPNGDYPLDLDPEEGNLLPWQQGKRKLPRDRDLPPVMRELVTNAPPALKVQVFVASTPALGTYAPRLRLQYVYDQSPSACLLQVIVCGLQSAGKSFARYVERVIMAPLMRRDEEQRREEQNYNELKRRQGTKDGKLPPEPKTDIVCLPPSVSITMLMKRADAPVVKYGAPKTLFMFADELSTITQSNKRAFADLKQIMKTAYDLGSMYGQDYLSETSYSTVVDVMLNCLFCGTPAAVTRYMDKAAIEGGNITRTILCSLESHIGDEPPTMKPLTTAQQEVIDHTLEQLMAATYRDAQSMQPEVRLDTQWLDRDVEKWCAARRQDAIKSCSRAIDVFYKRSSVSAFRIAALCQYLYQLEGMKGERDMRKCVRQIYLFMADYILSGMVGKWGNDYEQIQTEQVADRYHPSLLYENLPPEFSRDLLNATLQRLGQKTPAKVIVCRWGKLGWIEKLSKNHFRKRKN